MRKAAFAIGLAIAAVAAFSAPGAIPASADGFAESFNSFDDYWEYKRFEAEVRANEDLGDLSTEDGAFGSNAAGAMAAAAAPVVALTSETVALVNYGATVEDQEPTVDGRMRKTVWMGFARSKPARVVLHTFGSRIDTALALYQGDRLTSLRRVAFNDDKPVAGFGRKQSLIQFDAPAAARDYRLQIGSPSGEEDDVFLTGNVFPPGGGLSAFLARYNGHAFFNGAFVCVAPGACSPGVTEPTFILHNSMASPVTVTSSSTLGPGVRAPRPIVLAPGATAAAKFSFTAGFDATTVRTISGRFLFSGRVGGKLATTASHAALIVVKSAFDGVEPVEVKVDAQTRAGPVGELRAFDVDMRNVAGVTVRGCHARGAVYQPLDVLWNRIDPDTGNLVGPANQPFAIAPGKTARVRVAVLPRQASLADPTFDGDVIVDCANAREPNLDQSNHFGVTARARAAAADVLARTVAPVTGVVVTPAGRTAAFRVTARNVGATARLVARPVYVRPFDDAPGALFAATVCETDGEGACLRPAAASAAYVGTKNALKHFKVFVRGPTAPPAFDPSQRRIFLMFEQALGAGRPGDMIVGAESVAVRAR
jgi:hypothetical protein